MRSMLVCRPNVHVQYVVYTMLAKCILILTLQFRSFVFVSRPPKPPSKKFGGFGPSSSGPAPPPMGGGGCGCG